MASQGPIVVEVVRRQFMSRSTASISGTDALNAVPLSSAAPKITHTISKNGVIKDVCTGTTMGLEVNDLLPEISSVQMNSKRITDLSADQRFEVRQ
jgi:hypothetical protein